MNTIAFGRFTERFVAAGRLVGASCALATIAGCGEFELPSAPDMSALVQAYDHPDGELSIATAEDVGLQVVGTVSETKTSSPIELMGEMVTNLQQIDESKPASDAEPSEDEGGNTLLGEKLDVAAVARVHHVCRGWEGKVPPNQPLNGSLELTATFDSKGLIPTIWGSASKCRNENRGTKIELDGDVRIRIGDTESRINLGEFKNIGYLVEYEGTALILNDDDEPSELDLHTHFRVIPGDQVQVLIALSDGTAVVGVFDLTSLDPNSPEPMISAGLLTRDSIWSCSINLNNASGSCTDANDPTSTITW